MVDMYFVDFIDSFLITFGYVFLAVGLFQFLSNALSMFFYRELLEHELSNINITSINQVFVMICSKKYPFLLKMLFCSRYFFFRIAFLLLFFVLLSSLLNIWGQSKNSPQKVML